MRSPNMLRVSRVLYRTTAKRRCDYLQRLRRQQFNRVSEFLNCDFAFIDSYQNCTSRAAFRVSALQHVCIITYGPYPLHGIL